MAYSNQHKTPINIMSNQSNYQSTSSLVTENSQKSNISSHQQLKVIPNTAVMINGTIVNIPQTTRNFPVKNPEIIKENKSFLDSLVDKGPKNGFVHTSKQIMTLAHNKTTHFIGNTTVCNTVEKDHFNPRSLKKYSNQHNRNQYSSQVFDSLKPEFQKPISYYQPRNTGYQSQQMYYKYTASDSNRLFQKEQPSSTNSIYNSSYNQDQNIGENINFQNQMHRQKMSNPQYLQRFNEFKIVNETFF